MTHTLIFCHGYTSCIDHFALSSGLFESIVKCNVNECPTNSSDHHNISIVINWNLHNDDIAKRYHEMNRTAWYKVNDENIAKYKMLLDQSLSSIVLPNETLNCGDIYCKNRTHKTQLNDYVVN